MFKTLGEAREYCERFGLKVAPLDTFDAAETLHRAFVAGQNAAEQGVQRTIEGCEADHDVLRKKWGHKFCYECGVSLQ